MPATWRNCHYLKWKPRIIRLSTDIPVFCVRDILGLVGAPAGESLRGKALSLVVRITGNDGYSVIFALAEFDPGFSDRTIVLANKQDGDQLPDNAAPFRVVIPGDSHPARWVRQVKSIEVIPVSQ